MLRIRVFAAALAFVSPFGAEAQSPSPPPAPQFILEGYPTAIADGLSVHGRQLEAAATKLASAPLYVLVPATRRWRPGQTVTVAFKGGEAAVHAKIAAAARAWTAAGAANLRLSFHDAEGNSHVWSTSDQTYKADIRISFDHPEGGYWSMLGSDSIDKKLNGGRPNQASMNLNGFDTSLPPDWEIIVKHEFGHALGFEHEHQHPTGGCDFRFEDDAGYVRTKDADGWYTSDAQNRRPGLYTFLGGYKNFWPRTKVDFNLKALETSSAYTVGAFDRASMMKYFFDPFMFDKGETSECFTATANASLSPQDIAGAQRAYPSDLDQRAAVENINLGILRELQSTRGVADGLRESAANRLLARQ